MKLKQKDGLSYPCRTEVSAACTRVWMGREARANKRVMMGVDVNIGGMQKDIE